MWYLVLINQLKNSSDLPKMFIIIWTYIIITLGTQRDYLDFIKENIEHKEKANENGDKVSKISLFFLYLFNYWDIVTKGFM